jgi:putative addiction module CopG family antidote
VRPSRAGTSASLNDCSEFDKVESGLYQTASEVVRGTLRLLKERDQAREQLRVDVQSGFNQLMRGDGVVYGDPAALRALATRIKAEGRQRRERKG